MNYKEFLVLRNALFINLLIGLLFWTIFYPGFYSSDSFGVINMVKEGNLNSNHTALYALYVTLFSLKGEFPAFVTFVNTILLISATTFAAWKLPFSNYVRFLSSIAICVTPLVWAMSVTFWHDIPFTAGLIFLTVALLSRDQAKHLYLLIVLGAILISFRPNGIPTILCVLFLTVLFKKLREYSSLMLFATLISISSSLLASSAINSPVIVEHFGQEWMRNDISCAVAKDASLEVNRALNEKGTPSRSWSSIEACSFLNRAEVFQSENFSKSYDYIPTIWLKLLRDNPLFIVTTHLNRNYYLVPLPYQGLRSVPFLHTNIEMETEEIKWKFPTLAEQIRKAARAWNYFNGVFAYSGLWLLLLVIFAWRKRDDYLNVLLVFFVPLTLTLFVVAPIPDARYALPVLILGQLVTFAALLERVVAIFERRNASHAIT